MKATASIAADRPLVQGWRPKNSKVLWRMSLRSMVAKSRPDPHDAQNPLHTVSSLAVGGQQVVRQLASPLTRSGSAKRKTQLNSRLNPRFQSLQHNAGIPNQGANLHKSFLKKGSELLYFSSKILGCFIASQYEIFR